MNLKAALTLAEKGMAVFPCWQNRKTPVTKNGHKEATTDPEIIEAWFSAYPTANIAVATGRVSGVFVVDIDVKHGKDGEADLRALVERHGSLPQTVESITPSKGRHLWFRMPEHAVPSNVGKLAPGLDIRGDGGYVLVPPSRVDGSYNWSVDSASEFADAPEWLFPTAEVAQLDMRRPEDHWRRISKGVSEGSRNASAASLAGYLLRKGVDPQTTLDLLIAWDLTCTPPQGGETILATVESILRKELERRGKAI